MAVLSNGVTAINSNGVAGNEVGRAGGQVHGCPSNFLRLTPPARRRARENLVVHGSRANRGCHISCNPPWCDGIDLNVVRRELNGHRFGQLDDGALRRTVRRNEPRPKERIHTGNVDDLAAVFTNHRSGSELAKKENRVELRLDDAVPILRLLVHDTATQRYVSSIIHKYADAAQFTLDLVDSSL